MFATLCPPVLGVVQELMTVFFVVVAIGSWIYKQIQGQNNQMNAPVPRPGRPRAGKIDDEFEAFVQNVNRNKTAPPARAPEPQRAPAQRPGNRPKQQGGRAHSQPARPQPATERERYSQDVSQRKQVRSGDLGQDMRQHLQQYMGERVQQTAKKDLGAGLKQPPPPPTATAAVPPGQAPSSACCLRHTILNRKNIKQAILIHEILSPPKSRRK